MAMVTVCSKIFTMDSVMASNNILLGNTEKLQNLQQEKGRAVVKSMSGMVYVFKSYFLTVSSCKLFC